jgi:hypothetical protein
LMCCCCHKLVSSWVFFSETGLYPALVEIAA